jgi:hypothetical protein
MAKKVKELFVKVGAETSELKRGLREADASIRASQRLWTNEFAKNLSRPIDTNNLKAVNREMDKLGDRAQEVRRKMLGVTADAPEYAYLRTELRMTEERMKALGAASEHARQRRERLLGMAGSAGNYMLMGAGALVGAAGLGLKAAADVGAYAEEIDNLSIKTGLATDKIQVLRLAAESGGLSFQSIANGIADVQKKLMGVEDDSGAAADAFKRLGISIHDANGNLLPMDALIPQLLTKLQGITNATERNMIASQIFGKGWKELAPILGMSAAEFSKLEDKFRSMGLIMSGEAINKAKEFDDAMDDIKMQLAGLARDVGTDLIPIFRDELFPVIKDTVIPIIRDLAKLIGDINPEVVKWGFGFLVVGGSALKAIQGVAALKEALAVLKGVQIGSAVAGAAGSAATGAGAAAAGGGLAGLTASITSMAGAAAAAAPWVIAIVGALADIGMIAGKFYYDHKAKVGMKQYEEEYAKSRPKIQGMYQAAGQHNDQAKALGYASWGDMIRKANKGDAKAQADLRGINPNAKALQTPTAPTAGATAPVQDERERLAAQLGIDALRAEGTRSARDYSDQARYLRSNLAASTDPSDRARLQTQLANLEQQSRNEAELNNRRIAWAQKLSSITDDAQKQKLQSQMEIELADLQQVHREKLRAIAAEGEARDRAAKSEEERRQKILDLHKQQVELAKNSALAMANTTLFKNAGVSRGLELGYALGAGAVSMPTVPQVDLNAWGRAGQQQPIVINIQGDAAKLMDWTQQVAKGVMGSELSNGLRATQAGSRW